MAIVRKIFELLSILPNGEKVLGLKGETVAQYKTRLYKRSGELYGMLHNRDKQATATMTKEAILSEMAEVEKLKDNLFNLVENPRLKWKL